MTHTMEIPELPPNGRTETPAEKLFVRDLVDGSAIDTVFLVKERSLHKKKNGEDYLRLTLADSSGTVPAVCWEQATESHGLAGVGAVVRIQARYAISDRYGPQLTVQALSAVAPGNYQMADLLDGPTMSLEQMEADLRRLIETVQSRHLRLLLDRLFGKQSATWRRFRSAPAAKFYHQAYVHGLLEHTLLVGQAVSAISASFPGIDRDVAVTGAVLHDIGKIEAYTMDPAAIELTDDGKLLGEIPLGYYLVRREIEAIDSFPWELARALLHIILSHHGALENGSPVLPATREATLVHTIDNLGGKLGSFDRLQKELPDGETWSAYDRALAGSAYFATVASPRPEAEVASAQ